MKVDPNLTANAKGETRKSVNSRGGGRRGGIGRGPDDDGIDQIDAPKRMDRLMPDHTTEDASIETSGTSSGIKNDGSECEELPCKSAVASLSSSPPATPTDAIATMSSPTCSSHPFNRPTPPDSLDIQNKDSAPSGLVEQEPHDESHVLVRHDEIDSNQGGEVGRRHHDYQTEAAQEGTFETVETSAPQISLDGHKYGRDSDDKKKQKPQDQEDRDAKAKAQGRAGRHITPHNHNPNSGKYIIRNFGTKRDRINADTEYGGESDARRKQQKQEQEDRDRKVKAGRRVGTSAPSNDTNSGRVASQQGLGSITASRLEAEAKLRPTHSSIKKLQTQTTAGHQRLELMAPTELQEHDNKRSDGGDKTRASVSQSLKSVEPWQKEQQPNPTAEVGAYRVQLRGGAEGRAHGPSASVTFSKTSASHHEALEYLDLDSVPLEDVRNSDYSSAPSTWRDSTTLYDESSYWNSEYRYSEQTVQTDAFSPEPIAAELVEDNTEITELVTELLQEELAQQVEKQVQDRLEQEGQQAVQADDAYDGGNPYSPDIKDEDNKNKFCKWAALAVCGLAVVIVGVVVIVVVMNVGGDNDQRQPPTSPPTEKSLGTRFDDLFIALRPYLINLPTDVDGLELSTLYGLDDISEYQYTTLDWLANIDDAKITTIDRTKTGTVENDETPLPLEEVLERFVVALIYFSTAGNTWGAKNTFLDSVSVCEWNDMEQNTGVFCEGRSVREIRLPEHKLFGSLPSEIGLLSHLEVLDFDTNNLFGSIPSELYELSQLRLLWLRENNLRGSISSQVGQLKMMESFDLADNSMTGTIPTEIGLLSGTLRSAILRNNQFGDGGLPSELGSLTRLTRLDLLSTQLQGTIPTVLGQLVLVEHLFLEKNAFDGTIPTELGRLSSLVTLFMYENSLTGTVPEELSSSTFLTNILFHENKLSGGLNFGLCKNIDAFSGLERLYADCGGDVPDLSCSCCTHCCDESGICSPQRSTTRLK